MMLLDMDMPHLSGMDIIKHVSEQALNLPIVVLTGVGDVELAVSSLKLGVFDYLTKPVDDDHLLEVIGKAIELGTTRGSIRTLPTQLSVDDLVYRDAFDHLRSGSPEMVRLLHQAEKMAAGDLCIFIFGEQGRASGPWPAITGRARDATVHKISIDAAARDVSVF